MPMDVILSTVLQYGSFGVLVLIIIYFGKKLIPEAITAFRQQGTDFQTFLQKQEDRHDIRLNRRDQICDKLADNVGKIAEQVNLLSSRLETVEEKKGTK